MRYAPTYITPLDQVCPNCDEQCEVVPLLNDYDYAGSHQGGEGTHYPQDWGNPVSSCCDAEIDDAVRGD